PADAPAATSSRLRVNPLLDRRLQTFLFIVPPPRGCQLATGPVPLPPALCRSPACMECCLGRGIAAQVARCAKIAHEPVVMYTMSAILCTLQCMHRTRGVKCHERSDSERT